MLILRSIFSSLSFIAAFCSISLSALILSLLPFSSVLPFFLSSFLHNLLPFLPLSLFLPHNTIEFLTCRLLHPIYHYTSLQGIMSKNKVYKSFIGLGYYETLTPGVIQRNVSLLTHLPRLFIQLHDSYSYFHASFHFRF